MRARGRAASRHTPGRMNKLEEKYSWNLEERKIAGEIQKWRFESLKLRLADRTFVEVDFYVIDSAGFIEFHEVKARWEDDARVKMKVAAEMWPEFKFVGFVWDKKQGWIEEEF